MLHVYNVYNMLPKLRKIGADEVFAPVVDKHLFMRQKRISLESSQKCILEHDLDDKTYMTATNWIVRHYPGGLWPPYSLHHIAPKIPYDIAIHRLGDDSDWLAFVHACYPNGWSPEEIIGRSYDEIHAPVPGIKLGNSRKILEACVNGIFERYVWGVFYERRINCHSSIQRAKFDPLIGEYYVKVERQVMVGLPECRAFLFVLHQEFIPPPDIDKTALLLSLRGMTPEHASCKGITSEFVNYLSNSLSQTPENLDYP